MTALDRLRLQHTARQLRETAAEIRKLAPLEALRLEGVASSLERRIEHLTRVTEIAS